MATVSKENNKYDEKSDFSILEKKNSVVLVQNKVLPANGTDLKICI